MSRARKEEMIKVSAIINIASPDLPEGFTVGSCNRTHETLRYLNLGEFKFPALEEDDFDAPLLGPDEKIVLNEKGLKKLEAFWQNVHNEKIRDLLRSLSGIYPSWEVQTIKLWRAEALSQTHAEYYIDFREIHHFEKTSLTPGS